MDKARLLKRQFMMKQTSSVCNGGKLNSTNQDNEMGGESQGEEEELQPLRPRNRTNNKKSKLHSKLIIVDHANVPRKLRSAMSKRSRESLSPPLSQMKKPRHTSTGLETPRSNSAKKSKENLKQEGEAAQTVSCPISKDEEEVVETLFSLARMSPKDKPIGSTGEGLSPSEDSKDNPQLAAQAAREASTPSQLICSAADLRNPSAKLEGSSKQSSLPELTIMGRPIQYGNTSTALADLLRTSLPSRGAIPLADPSELGVSPELCHVTGSVESVQGEFPCGQQKLNHGFWPAPNDMEKEELHLPMHKGSGRLVASMEGTQRILSCGGEVHGPSKWSPSTKIPPWLEAASPSTRTAETTVLTEQFKPAIVDLKKPYKRCAAHVHISRIIQAHQAADKKSRSPVLLGQFKANERSNGVTSTASTYLSPLGKSTNESQTANFQDKRLLQDQRTSISSPGTYSSEKKGMEPSTTDRFQGGNMAYLNPFLQHPLMSLPLSHLRPSSSQVSPLYFPGHIGPSKQHQEQQHHQLWAAQLASQYTKQGGNSTIPQLPRWQNGIQDSPSSSSSPFEQQLFALSSSMQGGRKFQSDVSPHLQLVCSAENI